MSMETLTALSLDQCDFTRFGTAILPVDDMTPHSSCDAELKFNGDNLRYYVMRLHRRAAVLGSICLLYTSPSPRDQRGYGKAG